MSRPCNRENIMSVSDTVVWAFQTYGFPKGSMDEDQPCNLENLMSVQDMIAWAWGG